MERQISKKEKADIRVLTKFVALFCEKNHDAPKEELLIEKMGVVGIVKKNPQLCRECASLLKYGLTMRLRCPHDPKPMCKKCNSQCYRADYKKSIREVMKFSGMYLVKRGRLDLLLHFLR